MLQEVENKDLLESKLLGSELNLFLGAGFSVLSRDLDGNHLPVGPELARNLIEKFGLSHLSSLGLGELCTIINLTQREALRDFLNRRFTVSEFDDRYLRLDQLDIANIFTTNIDDLPQRIFQSSNRHYLNDVDLHGPSFRDRRAINYFGLHGTVRTNRRPLRFGALETASSFGSDPDRWWYLKSQLCKWPTVFWGYSFGDAGTLEALSRIESPNDKLDAWILVYPDENAAAAIEYFRALGLQILIGTTEEMLAYLEQLLESIASDTDHNDAGLQVPVVESIPQPGATATRPVEHFFRGSPPTWSDVYSGVVTRLSHSRSIENAIAAGDNVIITGVPVCGKTTLLMQLAAHVDFAGHKMLLESPTREKAAMLARKVGDQKALVFIDNATNDAESLRDLIDSPNIQVVAADRSYHISIVSHILPISKCNVFEISELAEREYQRLRDTIPVGMRTGTFKLPEVTPGLKPSLYEFIQANVVGPTLAERFSEAMRELRGEDEVLLEMLLLVSYVHSCRTPLSMDMALAYWRGRVGSYKGIYVLMDDAGKLVHDYYGDLADDAQDYYSARSVLVADTILQSSDRETFRNMLLRFHKNVSMNRICHYEVFRRRAFDARRIGARAFTEWEEARDFYEFVYQKAPNPYVRQQEALFLSAADRHTEAFQVIEQAAAEGGSANWTIRNTYAIILFRRNILFAGDDVARSSLIESMEILERCYSSDRRKGFHAKTFADHALQFWRAYHDSDAARYIRLSAEWLSDAARNEPWDRTIPPLLSAIRAVNV